MTVKAGKAISLIALHSARIEVCNKRLYRFRARFPQVVGHIPSGKVGHVVSAQVFVKHCERNLGEHEPRERIANICFAM